MEALIQPLLRNSENETNLCTSFILLWIASSDGEVHQTERDFLFKHMVTANQVAYHELSNIIAKQDFASFLFVCRTLKNNLDHAMQESLLTMSISIAIVDKRLSISEVHILRLLADLLSYSPARFSALYADITGTELTDPGDPSSMAWWRAKQVINQKKSQNSGEPQHKPAQNQTGMSSEDAYAVLGLQVGSNQEDVIRTYKKFAKAYHRNHSKPLESDHADASYAEFMRIKEAYKVLTK